MLRTYTQTYSEGPISVFDRPNTSAAQASTKAYFFFIFILSLIRLFNSHLEKGGPFFLGAKVHT